MGGMVELVVLIGLQASGKSTFRRERFDGTHLVVSKDRMPNNRRRSRRQAQLIEEGLSQGRPVVVDNTNPRLEDRAELIALAKRFGARVTGYFFPAATLTSLERNSRRTGRERVPDVGIFATAKVLRPPSLSEGFDVLYRVTWQDDGVVVIEPVEGVAV